MCETTEFQAYAVHLRAEHRRLHDAVRQIQSALVALPSPTTERDECGGLAETLEKLRGELSHHFAEEEEGGCIEEAVARLPRLAAEARKIDAEHVQLLAELGRIIAHTRTVNRRGIQPEFDEFIRRLLKHEALENKILEQGFNIPQGPD